MAPFRYSTFDTTPYVQSASDLLQAPARAQAAAALASGNAWAGAANQVGQSIAAIPGQIQQQKHAAVQNEAATLQLGETKRAISARDAFAKIIKDTPQTVEDGVSLYDIPAVANQLAAAGQDPGAAVEHLGKINDAFRQERAAKTALVKTGAASIAAAGNDPVLAGHFLDQLEKNGSYTKAEVSQFRDFIGADPGNTAKLTAYLMGPQKMENAAAGSMARNPITGALVPGSAVPEDPNKGAYTINGQRFKADGTPLGAVVPSQAAPKSIESKPVLLDGKQALVNFNPATGQHTLPDGTDVSSRVKPIPAASLTIHNQNAQAPNLPAWALDDTRPTGPDANKLDPATRMTPNGLYQAAMNNIATGQFPPTGRGSDPASVATRTAITSKVGAIAAAAGMDEPALRAFYKSNAASLAQQQKMQDSVQGFMATADKNAALLQESLKKIPDIGVPLFNKPLRSFASSVSGDPNMSQFATYLQSVQNEYARIISQPNLAGQLTDSARHEAETLLDPKATVPQIVASIDALQKEGNNRLVSVGEQIQRIQKRMQVGPTDGAPKADPLGLFGPKKP